MADDAHIFNIRTPITLERIKLETSNLVSTSTGAILTACKKLGQKECDSLDDLELNLRTPVNISRTVKATGFKFIMQIDLEKWKISSSKVGQKRT